MENKNSVLIVDDEKSNLLYLNHILGDDYKIFTARDAGEAIKRANKYRPDLILLDVVMPDMSGYEAITTLKESDETKEIPVIFVTGLSGSEDEMKGLDLGADDYITKPFNDTIVKLRVRNQIKIVNQMRAIERLSMVDQLTDIANRRSFDIRIASEWSRAVRDQSAVSVMMIDVDRFKNYNDTYGHQQGDTALKTVAGILERNLKRPGDLAARWGGEEFSVLLPMTDAAGALAMAESIRADIENAAIPCEDGSFTSVTASIGVNSVIPSRKDFLDAFLLKADNALYTAKETGRNRVCQASG